MNIPKKVTARMVQMAANRWLRCIAAFDVGPVETYNAMERYFAYRDRFMRGGA